MDPLENLDAFFRRVRERMDVGRVEYGDRSFASDPLSLVNEIQEEILDIAGWSYVLYCRMERVREKNSELSRMLGNRINRPDGAG